MGCDIHTVGQIRGRDGKWETKRENIADEWRTYDSFAVLANVRNGSGFAGCDTGEGWKPIAEPRGLPEGFKMKYEDHIYDYDEKKKWMGDHSHSWVTLKELKDKIKTYKNKLYEIHGMISLEQYKQLQSGKIPDNWCEYTNAKDYVRTTWKVSCLKRLKWLTLVVKELELILECSYEDNIKDEDVRMVFGFDS